MSERTLLTLNVGDLVFDGRQLSSGLGVVVELEPFVQTADILEETGANNGLCLGLAGTTDPACLIGAIPLDEIANGLVQSNEIYQSLGYDFLLTALHAAATQGPKTIFAQK